MLSGLQRVPPHTVEIYPVFEGETEIIIAVKEDEWGAGYATEALGALLTYALDALNEPRLVALVDAPNLASRPSCNAVASARSERRKARTL
jgi:RimJ/RimL family protein N-acetyltransferase